MKYELHFVCHILLWICLQHGYALSGSSIHSVQDRNLIDKVYRPSFHSRSKSGERLAVLSFSLDPERDRRSILVPDGEGLLKEISLPKFRHSSHRFIPPITDTFSEYNNSFEYRSANTIDSPKPGWPIKKQPRITNSDSYESSYRKSNSITPYRKSRRNKYKDKDRKKKNKNRRRKLKQRKKKKRLNSTHPRIYGEEACQYKILKLCSKKSHIIPKRVARGLNDYQKCGNRQKFLSCVEKKRNKRKCKSSSKTRGNITKLRAWINKVFQTSFSCLLNESLNR